MTMADSPARTIKVVQLDDFQTHGRARSTDGRIVYAIGDIHGCYEHAAALLEAIVADIVVAQPAKPPLLVFIGDYVDRGSRPFSVMTMLVWLARSAPLEVAFLRGNHEAMLLGFLVNPDKYLTWLQRDGAPTLRDYGVRLPESGVVASASDCARLRNELLDCMPASHVQFLVGLPIRVSCGDYVFVHAGLRPGVKLSRQTDEDCLWIGDDFVEAGYKFEKVVVHGHSWRATEPEVTPHRIGLDTGAYSTGVLTAVRLEGSSMKFMQARMADPTEIDLEHL